METRIKCLYSVSAVCEPRNKPSPRQLFFIHIPFYKKLLSYLYPITLRKAAGTVNPDLELALHNNRLQLGSGDALYSDGDKYRPAVITVRKLKKVLPEVNNVLVLGIGLASMVQVMHKNGYFPHFTLVEIDEVVLQWAMELLPVNERTSIEPVCNSAMAFMERNTAQYDLIFIDIFDVRVVPDLVFTPVFLNLCKSAMTPGSHIVFNYIINDPQQWERVHAIFLSIFPDTEIVATDVNRILIARVP